MKYSVCLINKDIAKRLVVENHYSHSWTSCRYAFGLFDKDALLGVAVYGFPVGRQVVKSITATLSNEDVLELTRLWVSDNCGKNSESWFISKTFDWLRVNTNIKVLISYSDPMHNHLGVIYQATNWLYQGNNTMLIKGFLHKVEGRLMHPRTVVATYGTINSEVLTKIDPNYKRVEMKKKHRYIYILRKNDKKNILSQLKHPIKPYPKNNDNSSW